ncbi:MAG TPA: ABC transporter substrate-binding protein, partial [Saprospiraceae bacterium]|nr:ABC transporter substrate-binding protein [Saprospiraceae bacterium]
MIRQRQFTFICIACAIVVLQVSCKTNSEQSTEFAVNVRLPSEPENLHPMLTNSSYGIQIAGQVLLPAAEFDPVSLQLTPLLITEVPKGENINEGKHSGGKIYKMSFRPEAAWDNGSPVTAEDYLFTLKAVLNPYVNAPSLKSFLSFITEVKIDEADPKTVSVYIDSNYILSLEIVTNFNIYPRHVYDPGNIMSHFSHEELRDPNKKWTPEQDSLLKMFADTFQSVRFLRDVVEGAGPYQFDSWVTGEYITLKRKENWWGDKVTNPPLLLHGYPQILTYRFITDAATAEAALKSGEIDIISEVPPSSFLEMKEDPEWKDKFHFETPELLQIYYLELNNRDSILADPRIRKALAYSIDYDGIMNNLVVGLGKRATGPIHPQRSYYHKGLQPIKQNINRSLELIKEAGWKDSNGNGT